MTSLPLFGFSVTQILLCSTLHILLKTYILIVTLRVSMEWFPNMNPWREPFRTISTLADPYIKFFQMLVPRLFSFDFSIFVAFGTLVLFNDVAKFLALIQSTKRWI